MTEKCQKFFFKNIYMNKSTWKINSYFGIIAQILNTSRAELAGYYNKLKCI